MLKATLKQHIDINNLRYIDVSKAIGYSEASLSQYLSGTYQADTNKIEKSITSYLEREKARLSEVVKNPDFIMTNTVETIVDTARLCHLDKRIRVICGEAGTGKTTAINEYERSNKGVIVVNSNITISPKKLCSLICKKLNIVTRYSTGDMLDNIISALKDTDKLIIIDESEYLPYKALEIVRTIYNECNIGILLVGTPELFCNLKGKNNKYVMLWSRVTSSTFLKRLTMKETRAFIKQYFEELEDEVILVFHNLSGGNARTLINMIINTVNIHNKTMKPVSPLMVQAAVDLSMKGQV